MVDTNNFFELLGYVVISKYRKSVLEVLAEGPKTIDEIVNELDVKKRPIKKATNELKSIGLIDENNEEFSITERGMKVRDCANNRGA